MTQSEKSLNITGETLVCDLFVAYPAARTVFERYGYRGCGGPNGPSKPIAVFSSNHDVPLQRLIAEIHETAGLGHDNSGPPREF